MDIDDAWKARNEPGENISWEKLREEFELRNIASSLKVKITSRLGQKGHTPFGIYVVLRLSSVVRPPTSVFRRLAPVVFHLFFLRAIISLSALIKV